jgi:hypothetical protein
MQRSHGQQLHETPCQLQRIFHEGMLKKESNTENKEKHKEENGVITVALERSFNLYSQCIPSMPIRLIHKL